MGIKPASCFIALLALLCVDTALARGPWRADEGNTTGWDLMSPEERVEHQARIRGFKSYEPCQAYQQEHHRLMVAKATERGLNPPGHRRDFCEHLKESASKR